MELDITECLAIARTRLAELDDLESPTPDEIDEIEALESLAAYLQEIARKLDQAAA